jgi:ubiquinone/menaquinone biosynthesis C-methylase UbiE
MERLAGVDEILDGPLDDVAEVAGNLRDLRRVNRLLGGTRLSRLAIERLVPGDAAVSLLDVGTGGADIPVSLLADAARRGRLLRVTAIDSRPEVLEAARVARPSLDAIGGLSLAVADGLALPYPDGAFDVAHSSMVVHHLERPDAVAMLRELTRVARVGIALNDLVRGDLYWAGAWLMSHTLTLNRLTRNDAPLSVRRAYTRQELRELVGEAGLRIVAEFAGFAGHRVAIAAVPA